MDIDELLAEPRRRRLWLLSEAMACAALDRALELARAADEFVVGNTETTQAERVSETDAPKNAQCDVIALPRLDDATALPRLDHEEPKAGLTSLLPERREELLDRIARGETNATLAVEFGLTRKQVQGLRMGAARQIASRRPAERSNTLQNAPERISASIEPERISASIEPERISASIEDVVRYLRQQNDVVVPEGSNRYLVNARFHLDLAELLAKANKVRARHNKPLFQLGELPGPIVRPNGSALTPVSHGGPFR